MEKCENLMMIHGEIIEDLKNVWIQEIH